MQPSRIQRLALPALSVALLVVLLLPSEARAASSAWAENEQSRVRLITPYEVAPRSGELRLGLHYTLSPGWHVYWKNSGDAGFAPTVVFQKAEGLGEAELLWPAPHRFELPGDLVAFGYEDEVVYPVRTTIEAAGRDRLEVTATLDYLVCEVDCIPYRYDLKLTQPLGDKAVPDPQTAPLVQQAWGSLPTPAERLAGVTTEGTLIPAAGGANLEVRVAGAQGDPGGVDLFLEAHEQLDAGKPVARKEGDGLVFRVPLSPREAGKPLERTTFAWTVTGLRHNGQPVSLEARREVEIRPAAAPGAVSREGSPSVSLPGMLLAALFGGLLLNLMPSVVALLLPALFELRRDSPATRPVGMVVLGILVTCWAAAALSTVAHRAGWPAGWGSQLQEPAVATLLILAAAWTALNLWGLAGSPLAVEGTGTSVRPVRPFLVGLLTPALAFAWILPVLTAPVGFAAERGAATAFAIYTALGLGLALPYLLPVAIPRALPQPGPWLRPLREALGFAAAGGAFWLLYALSRQVSAEGLAWIELALLGMALFAWLRHRTRIQVGLKFLWALCLVVSAILALWLADRNRLSPRPADVPAAEASLNP